MEEDNKNLEQEPVAETPAVEPVPEVAPVESVPAEQPVPETAPVEQPVVAQEEPKKKGNGGLILILLILVIGGGFAAWYFALGGKDVLAGKKEEPKQEEKQEEKKEEEKKEETKEDDKKEEEKKEEEKKEESSFIADLTEEEANKLVDQYKINYEGLVDDNHPHCGALVNIFQKGGSTVDVFSEWERQIVIISNLKLNNFDKSEFSLTEYIEEGKKLFGSKYEAKVVKNEGNIYSGLATYFKYDESTKTLTIKESQGGGICSPHAYKVKFVSGKKYSDKILLGYRVFFSADYEDINEYTSNTDFENGAKYVVTFVKDGENYVFSKAE